MAVKFQFADKSQFKALKALAKAAGARDWHKARGDKLWDILQEGRYEYIIVDNCGDMVGATAGHSARVATTFEEFYRLAVETVKTVKGE